MRDRVFLSCFWCSGPNFFLYKIAFLLNLSCFHICLVQWNVVYWYSLYVMSVWKFVLKATNSYFELVSHKMKKEEFLKNIVMLCRGCRCEVPFTLIKFWGLKMHGVLSPSPWSHKVCCSSHRNNFIKKDEITYIKLSEYISICNIIVRTLLQFVSKLSRQRIVRLTWN
jgi:hypothetical protein